MKALPLSSKFSMLKPDDSIYLTTPEGNHLHKIKSIKKLNRYSIVSFHGITDMETAIRCRGSLIQVESEAVSLEKGEFLYEQIIGLSVITTDGENIGTLTDIFETGSNDVYVVRREEKEYLIPAIKDVIVKIELDKNRIIIKVMEGLLD